MTESTRELFNNFKGTLTNYTSNAFGIGMHMSAYKTTPKETKEQYKTTIRNNIKDEMELQKELDCYAVALAEEYPFYQSIKNAMESLRDMSYKAGVAYYLCDKQEEYSRLRTTYNEDLSAFLKMMEEELENA